MAGSALSSFGTLGYPQPIADSTPPQGDRANAVVSGQFTAIGNGKAISLAGPANFAIWASYNTALTIAAAGSNAGTVGAAGQIATGASVNSVLVPPGTTIASIAGSNVTFAFPIYRLAGQLGSNGQISGLPWTAGLLGATVTGPGIPSGAITVTQTPATNPSLPAGTVQLSTLSTTPGTGVTPGLSGVAPLFNFALTANAISAGTDSAAIFTGAAITFSATVQLERSFDGGQTWLVANTGGSGTLAQYTAGTHVQATFGEPEQGALYRLNCPAYTSGTINYRISTTGAAGLSLAINQLS